ncbi:MULTISPECIES: HEAT repeat domain-containing protein [Streptomyces]|uniref:HEAT repeat domain-containing protein n=1 Tax=Streptomyces TaxID=1883 RepID=UPI00117D03E4|nr:MULTISPECIES: HEAT repeat domain-containing protein [Streptomyces]
MIEIRMAFTSDVDFELLLQHGRNEGWTAETTGESPIPSGEAAEDGAYFFSWRLGKGGAGRFVDDEVVEVKFFVFSGEVKTSTITRFRQSFPTATYKEFLDRVANDVPHEDQGRALETIGAIAPRTYTDAVYESVSRGLDGDTASVRTAAISAVMQLSWREFREPLKRVADHDPDPNNRAYATNTLYSLPQG